MSQGEARRAIKAAAYAAATAIGIREAIRLLEEILAELNRELWNDGR